jgi:hypothetical protein
MVEMAMSLMVFLTAIFLTIDLVRLSYQSVTSQLIAGRAIRRINVRPAQPSSTREHEIFEDILRLARNFGLPEQLNLCVNTSDPTGCRQVHTSQQLGGLQPNDLPDFGEPRQLISFSIRFTVPMFFNITSYEVNAAVIGRNEPFEV